MKTINNSVKLIGRLGGDPEFRNLENGKQVANFSLATSQTYKNQAGDKVTKTQWHRIVIWNGLAKVAGDFLKKGSQVAVGGMITYREYDNKDGIKVYTTEIVCDEMQMLDGKPTAAPASTENVSTQEASVASEAPASNDDQSADASTSSNEIDDLPF